MFRQVGIGAATVLSIGLLAAGCSEDGDTIITGGGNLLQNTDSTPFSGVTNNNLSNDGGGLTPNGSNADDIWRVEFNCDCPKSDGTYSGDGSAILLFQQSNNRVYATHFANGSFTPPVELEASDRDYGASVDLLSYVIVPLNTGNYQSGATNPATEVNTVRQNAGNWLIMGEFQTSFVLPGQTVNNSSTLGKGVRRTIGSWVFLTAERSKSLSTSAAVGGTTREFRYGFQRMGDEIATTHTAGTNGGGLAANLANNVMSYGVVTDGLCGQASFGGTGTPWTGGSTGTSVYSTTTPSYDDADYTAGEDVSCLAAVFTQVESSLSSDNNRLRVSATNSASSAGGQAFMRYRPFNLATLTWGTEAAIETGIDSNDNGEGSAAGEGVFPDFYAYNNTLFYRYMDASQADNTGTTFVNYRDIISNRVMIAAARFSDGGSGACTINTVGTGNALDISTDQFCVATPSAAGTPGAHTITQPNFTTTIGTANPAPSYEMASFIAFDGDSSQTQTIYGSDEGLEEISVFYLLADGTASGTGTTGSGPNSDAELAVVAISNSGALGSTPFVAGTNPIRISGSHATDNQTNTSSSSTTNVQLTDAVSSTAFVLNRTGRWIAAAFNRPNGVTEASANGVDLFVSLYQPFRQVASTTSSTVGGTAANMENRVSSANKVSTDQSVNVGGDNRTPVNTFGFQGQACYRGMMSDANAVSLFWEQSDGTGDRVFGAKLSVTLSTSNNPATAPTLGTVTAVELAFADNVLGDAAFINSNGTPGTSSFEWLNGNGDVTKSDHFQAVDAGSDNGSSTATLGNVLIAFTRVDDGTTTDSGTNDLGDVSVYVTTFNGSTFETPVKVGTTADTNEAIAGIATANNIKIDALVPLPSNTDISNKPSFPTSSDSGYFVLLLKDREASLNTASGSTTTTVVPGNASSRIAQFARRISFSNSGSSPAVTAIADRVFPSVNNTATSPFALPIQLDHAQGVTTDATQIEVLRNSSKLAVVFIFDNQIWYQVTQDGENWLRDGSTGLPNPGLISNFSSADTSKFTLNSCKDGNGDDGAAILNYKKADVQGTDRGHAASASSF